MDNSIYDDMKQKIINEKLLSLIKIDEYGEIRFCSWCEGSDKLGHSDNCPRFLGLG